MRALPILIALIKSYSVHSAVTFEGRIPESQTLADFNNGNTSAYDPSFVLGQNLKWSNVLVFVDVSPSLFDDQVGAKPVELTINDSSIFAPSSTNVQTGFRRAELLPEPDDVAALFAGIKAFHFSVRTDTERPLNYSHEYQIAFQEDSTFSTNQFAVKTGTLFGQTPDATGGKTVLIQGNQNTQPPVALFTTPFTDDVWHNFAIVQDFDKNLTQILYSTDAAALSPTGEPVTNDNSGEGQYHFGLLKKPTGENITDLTKQGFQESGIDEGIVLGGIFQESVNSFFC